MSRIVPLKRYMKNQATDSNTVNMERFGSPIPRQPPQQQEQQQQQQQQQHAAAANEDGTSRAFFDHSSADRVSTEAVLAVALRKQYPTLELVIVPQMGGVDLLGYAASGQASFTPIEDGNKDPKSGIPSSLAWTMYLPPARRIDGGMGAVGEAFQFGKFAYVWKGTEFLLYTALVSNSLYPPSQQSQFLLTTDKLRAEALVLEAGRWASDLHGQVLVFDGGYWQKNAELYRSVMSASWDSVIMDGDMKKAIIADHEGFFSSRDTYAELKVPWKRGLIYHGPPGNGKTISIKATMHMLYARQPEPVPTLYVRTLASFSGPEYSIKQIFSKARQYAPCYLVFEDLDSIVSDSVRSYFLNEVDGLKSNDGIFMVGSTNHLEQLDPGISKRPSRFDRKYYFPDPDFDQRVSYCEFWQGKLKKNKDVEFPDSLCPAVAGITDGFSFAYIQEAFVAALLAIARRSDDDDDDGHEEKKKKDHDDKKKMLRNTDREILDFGIDDEENNDWEAEFEEEEWTEVVPYRSTMGNIAALGVKKQNAANNSRTNVGGGGGGDDDGLERLVLWREIKRQVKTLREGMDD